MQQKLHSWTEKLFDFSVVVFFFDQFLNLVFIIWFLVIGQFNEKNIGD